MSSLDSMDLVPEISSLSFPARGTSLWTQLSSGLPGGPIEAAYVRSVIGDECVASSKRHEEELMSLLGILVDLRQRNEPPPMDSILQQQSVRPLRISRLGAALQATEHDQLRQRLQRLVASSSAGPTTDDVVLATLPSQRQREIAEYVLTGRVASARRPSSANRDGLSSSQGPRTPPLSGRVSATFHDPNEALEPVRARLNFLEVKGVVEQLRELFACEQRMLLEDIEHVRALIETEMTRDPFTPPSHSELKSLSASVSELEARQEHADKIRALPTAADRRSSTLFSSGSLVATPPPKMAGGGSPTDDFDVAATGAAAAGPALKATSSWRRSEDLAPVKARVVALAPTVFQTGLPPPVGRPGLRARLPLPSLASEQPPSRSTKSMEDDMP